MSRKVELVRVSADDAETLPGPPPQSRPAADVFGKDKTRMRRPDEDTIKKALGKNQSATPLPSGCSRMRHKRKAKVVRCHSELAKIPAANNVNV